MLHVDAAGDESQRNALADVFLGRHGGPQVGVLPWVRKMSNLVDVRPDRIELVAQGEGYGSRVGEAVRARATRPVPSDATVRCVIPGYDQPGQELVADELDGRRRAVRLGAQGELRVREPVRLRLRVARYLPPYTKYSVKAIAKQDHEDHAEEERDAGDHDQRRARALALRSLVLERLRGFNRMLHVVQDVLRLVDRVGHISRKCTPAI